MGSTHPTPTPTKNGIKFYTLPKELDASISMGPNHRTFVLTFYHQLHCIVELKEALMNRNDTLATEEHITHCLQYLRQTLLCQGNDKLEEGDFLERHFETDRLGTEMECYDWENVYQEVGARYHLLNQWKIKISS